ncbi:MAG: ATP-binding cassette domain-containing protein [Mesorhizobium sp.]|nr:MAG: ATP-binding cassette domain-containing protein [Mesorhizobium sp.]
MPDLTVAENMYVGLPPEQRPSPARASRVTDDILRLWSQDVAISSDRPVATLNPEQRFIVEICRAFAAKPKILILDEPTEHLHGDDVERLFKRVREIAATGTAVVYISHRLHEVGAIAQRITVLRDGKGQGTYATESVTEQQVVELIVGGKLEREFPSKLEGGETAPVVLRVEGLSSAHFSNVNLAVRRGEIIGLAGVSDNGQKEFLRSLAGLEKIKSGTVTVKDSRLDMNSVRAAKRAGIRLLPSDRHRASMFGVLSVAENFVIRSLDADSRLGFVSSSSERSRAEHAISAFRIKTPSPETRISSLSGGNQQKLIVSSVLAAEPDILLVEEPTQGVDVGARSEIYSILRSIAGKGTTILVLSSDATEIAGLCDRVVVFSRGQVVAELKGDDVTESSITSAVLTTKTVREKRGNAASALRAWAAGNWSPVAMVAIAILLVGLVGTYLNEFYLTPRNFGGLLALVATLTLVAYGQQLVMLIGGIDLSVGPLMGLVGVVGSFYLTADHFAGDYWIGFALMMAVALCLGIVNWILVDPLEFHPMVGTLITYMAVQAISLLLRPAPDGMIDYDLIDAITSRVGFVPLLFIGALLLGLVLEFLLYRSLLGVSLRGLGSREDVANLVGIAPRRMKFIAYVGCSLLAGLAGIALMTQVGIGNPTAGVNYTLSSVAAAVIGGASLMGGRGSFLGAFLGALLVIQVNSVAAFLGLRDAWQFLFLGIVILFSVAFYSKSRQVYET